MLISRPINPRKTSGNWSNWHDLTLGRRDIATSHIESFWSAILKSTGHSKFRPIREGGSSISAIRPAARDSRRPRRVRFQPNPIIHFIKEALFATQVPLRRLHRDVPQKELNLLQFSTGLMARTGASPANIVWRERSDLRVLCFLFHDTPNHFGAESSAPSSASRVDRVIFGTG